MEWTEWCKLCANEKGNLFNVVNPKNLFKILNIVEHYLQISLPFKDDSPSKMCSSCIQILDYFENYLTKVNNASLMFAELSETVCNLEDQNKLKIQYGLIENEQQSAKVEVCNKNINNTSTKEIKLPEKCEFVDTQNQNLSESSLDQHLTLENLLDDSCSQNPFLDDQDGNGFVCDDLSEVSEHSLEEKNLRKNDYLKSKKLESTEKIYDLLKNETEISETEINDKNDSNKYIRQNYFVQKIRRRKINKVYKPVVSPESKPIIVYKKITCEFCQKVLRTEFSYFDHLRKEHNIIRTEELPPCKYCGKILFSKPSLKVHEEGHLPVELKRYTCEICGFKVHNTKGLLRHKRNAHTTERPFVCETCGKSFKNKDGLNEHLHKQHTEDPVKCDICNKIFKNPIRLRIHKYHHKKKRTVSCLECGITFIGKNRLRYHMSIKHASFSEECILCGKTFTRNDFFRRHMIIHLNLRPYQCRFCEKRFNSVSMLLQHEKGKHSKKFEEVKFDKNQIIKRAFRQISLPTNEVLIEMLQNLKNERQFNPKPKTVRKRRKNKANQVVI